MALPSHPRKPVDPVLPPELADHAAEILKAVAHPIRLRIVSALSQGPEHVSGLSSRLGVSQPIISQQLRILRMRRLVLCTRQQGFALYQLAEPQLRALLGCVQRCSLD